MTSPNVMDLVVLTPGEDDREALHALFRDRSQSLGIRPITWRILKHPRRDPGVFHEAEEVLRPFTSAARYALAMFDYEGSGQENRSAGEVASDLRRRLEVNGWTGRAEVVLVEPELEQWVWVESPHVAEILGWPNDRGDLRKWLEEKGLWSPDRAKPDRPREAVEKALRQAQIPRSSALYRKLAERVGLSRCVDPAFLHLVGVLRKWFSEDGVVEVVPDSA